MHFVNQKLFQVKSYLRHAFASLNAQGVKNSFVQDFYKQAIKEGSWVSSDWNKIEEVRKEYLNSADSIEVLDFGAKGSPEGLTKHRQIADIAKNAGSTSQKGRLLSRIAHYLQPKSVLELGTSLGLGSLYLHTGAPDAFLHTFEGSPNTARLAETNFQLFSSFSYKVLHGEISTVLQDYLNLSSDHDLYFIDANHQYKATLEYYQLIKNSANRSVCIVFDDIYWSKGMSEAWKEIISENEVMLSLDLFWVGIVFFGDKQHKQHFTLRV